VNGGVDAIRASHRLAWTLGLGLCLGTPGSIAALLLLKVVPAGTQVPEGIYLQVGYLCTGLVFLSAAWIWHRSGQVLLGFKLLPEAERPGVVRRECLLAAAVFGASSLLGLVYWMLVGAHAPRHAWGFILMTPVLFLALVPRGERWLKALEP
jgi:hypothetical protein